MCTFSGMHGDIERDSLGLGCLRARCTAGAVLGAAGYVSTFITDLARHTPSDDSVVLGLEIGFAAAAILCALVATVAWVMTCHTGHSMSLMALGGRARSQIEDRASAVSERSVDRG